MPHISKILIYPIKSLDGVELTQAKVLDSGALEFDRQYGIFDDQGKYVNAKRYPKIHLLRSRSTYPKGISQFDLDHKTVSLQIQGHDTQVSFDLDSDRLQLDTWLSEFFGKNVQLQQNLITGFPDDTISPGPTIVTTATIREVTSWYEGLTETDIRRRIRNNIEIDGVPAFWEDRLFSENHHFQIGNLKFVGVNPCQRCIVPTRDAITGEVYSDFQKIFIQKRKETLPEWVDKSRFNHFYKLTVNTRLVGGEFSDRVIRVGDEIIF